MHLPPLLAACLTWAFIIFLFRRDGRENPNTAWALWLPFLWMVIISSRFVSDWLNILGLPVGDATLEEGSPIDAVVFFVLMAAGVYVLSQRQVNLSKFGGNNRWLTIFLLYCLVSIIWSDFPFVASKRWIKVLGHPIMALIVLTEPDPEEATVRLMKRCSYVILPISVMFIKYFPQWGRGFDPWNGAAINTGVTANKNALGCDCMVFGLFYFWQFLRTWNKERGRDRRNELFVCASFLVMTWWLLSMAHSSTALVSLLIGAVMIAVLGLRFVNKRLIGTYLIVGVIGLVVAESMFGIYGHAIQLLGKDPTLTDRTILWNDIFRIKINPLLGTGFESFWLGDRLQILWATRWWHPNEAHNGYLETYINLGLIGLFLFLGMILATFWKSRRELFRNFEFGRFRLGFLAAIVVYNWTEASFKALSQLWFVFYLIALDYPQASSDYLGETETVESEERERLVYANGDVDGNASAFVR